MLTAIITAVLFVYGFYALFLVYCTVRAAKKNGKLDATPALARAILYSYIAIGIAMDLVFNVTVGAIAFWEAPWGHGWLFTARCASHRHDGDWRQDLAEWVCEGWLNPHEAGHC